MNNASRRNAFTLLEVVVGLVLMGTLVASALVALSSQRHSIQLAKAKKEANTVSERLLTTWYEVRGRVPLRDQGIVQQNQDWIWRTYPIGTKTVCGLEANIVRLEVVGIAGNDPKPIVLVSLELLQSPNASGLR